MVSELYDIAVKVHPNTYPPRLFDRKEHQQSWRLLQAAPDTIPGEDMVNVKVEYNQNLKEQQNLY